MAKRKVTFTSTTWKCWQYVLAFAPFCQIGGASRLNPLRQYGGGVLYKSLGRSLLEAPFYSSRVPLEGLNSTCAHWEQHTCWENWTWEQTCYLGAMPPQMSGRSTHKQFRKFGESSAGQRLTSSPQKTRIAKLIFRRTGWHLPMTGPTSSFILFPRSPWSRR